MAQIREVTEGRGENGAEAAQRTSKARLLMRGQPALPTEPVYVPRFDATWRPKRRYWYRFRRWMVRAAYAAKIALIAGGLSVVQAFSSSISPPSSGT